MNKKILILPLLTFMLASCGDQKQKLPNPDIVNPGETLDYKVIINKNDNAKITTDSFGKKVGDIATITVTYNKDYKIDAVTLNETKLERVKEPELKGEEYTEQYKFEIVKGNNIIDATVSKIEIISKFSFEFESNTLCSVEYDLTNKKVGDEILIKVILKDKAIIDRLLVNEIEAEQIENCLFKWKIVEGVNKIRAVCYKATEPEDLKATVKVEENPLVNVNVEKTEGIKGEEVMLYITVKDPEYELINVTVNNKPASKNSDTVWFFTLETGLNVVRTEVRKIINTPVTPGEGETMLPNGQYKIGAPTNLNNPFDAHGEYFTFDCHQSMPQHWKYIYLNNDVSQNAPYYQEQGEAISLKFQDAGRGIQTPALVSAKKHEFRFNVTKVQPANGHCPDKSKPTFTIYGYDKNTDLIYNESYTPFPKGIDTKKQNQDITIYVRNENVSYFEVRFNDRIFDKSTSAKYVNIGVGSFTLKSYDYE